MMTICGKKMTGYVLVSSAWIVCEYVWRRSLATDSQVVNSDSHRPQTTDHQHKLQAEKLEAAVVIIST